MTSEKSKEAKENPPAAKVPAAQPARQGIHTISVVVSNKPGVLVRVALVFAKRGFNIDSLVVSPSVDPRFSRMTITAKGDPATLDQIIKQASKLIDVIHAGEHRMENSIEKELALLKIKCTSHQKPSLNKLLKRFHAHVLDDTNEAVIIEQTGSTVQLDELEELLKKYGIIEMVRTGKILMARGKEAT